VIEELFLPDSSGEIELARHPLACPLLPCPHKDRQFLRIQFGPAKEMNMIGHDHIAANCPTVTIVRIQPFIGQNSRSFVGSEDWSAFKSARCDEIGRPIDPNAFEPAQCLRIFIVVAGIGDPGRGECFSVVAGIGGPGRDECFSVVARIGVVAGIGDPGRGESLVVAGTGDPGRRLDPASAMPATEAVVCRSRLSRSMFGSLSEKPASAMPATEKGVPPSRSLNAGINPDALGRCAHRLRGTPTGKYASP